MAHFIETRASLVTDAIAGLLAAGGGRLARLDGDPGIRVVLRSELDPGKVAVISGGGSGHEPAHAGFVGPGMLSAAVCGDVFASPSVDAVLAGILAVTGPAGCLLIIKKYAGDRLNFGLAAERARALGKKVETVIVADDIALPEAKQPRGVAGTLFVHKIAGHAAEAGAPLETVAALARRVAASAQSLGIAVSTATIPGSPRSERLAEGQAELGLGIHGEPGVERIALPKAGDLARLMTERLTGAGPLALLVNNLGSATALEMQVLTQAVLATELGRRVRLLLGPAPLMTALDMHGASLSILPLDDALEAALLAPVPMPAWPGATRIAPPVLRPLPKGWLARPSRRRAMPWRGPGSPPWRGRSSPPRARSTPSTRRSATATPARPSRARPGRSRRISTGCRRPIRPPCAARSPNGSAARSAVRAACSPRSSSPLPRHRCRTGRLARCPGPGCGPGAGLRRRRPRRPHDARRSDPRARRLEIRRARRRRRSGPRGVPPPRPGWTGPRPAVPATSRLRISPAWRIRARPASRRRSRPWRRPGEDSPHARSVRPCAR